MGLKLEKHDGKWMMYSEGQLRLATFKLETKDWSLDKVDVPYNDRFGDIDDNHALEFKFIIDDITFDMGVKWDGTISDIVENHGPWQYVDRTMLIIPVGHGIYDFFKPVE